MKVWKVNVDTCSVHRVNVPKKDVMAAEDGTYSLLKGDALNNLVTLTNLRLNHLTDEILSDIFQLNIKRTQFNNLRVKYSEARTERDRLNK